ncbi:hypothetical protein G6F46_009908 [Rhizopus delemar]|uniref:Myb-like domain-containing protein n=2 Tax=Rhizopus TaxID=4842 RepID=A0A9P6YWK9_9FUNG|nr:hypothetical protein G6F55_010115 [Rhizopus delemar]KAG1536604.1 hypothetical protein G6F51_010873 [Rhizopus arrhizus]KAG1490971.1 hypothetical protein G6F54_010352 [Rhizopus delemar]KAG1499443.1 hypothetical protein G6F52_012654 [Rhizopus delemar]KAG1509725.1 hypothetical protein G6F53_007224 [Rhizopus delemar]
MNVSDLLNPLTTPSTIEKSQRIRCLSTPLLHKYQPHSEDQVINKSRSRFSEYEDNIIREGVAQGLTWGQISELLPHRKRATCFNRYRTLQGVRKSRKSSTDVTSPNLILQPQQQDILYQTKFSVNEIQSEILSSSSSLSSDDDDNESSYSPPPMTKTHRLHPINHTNLYRRHSAFHHF